MARLGFLESTWARRVSLVVCTIGSLLLAVDLVLLGLTYTSFAPAIAIFPPIFAVMFPLYGWAVITALRLRKSRDLPLIRRGGIDMDKLFSEVPGLALGAAAAVIAAAIVAFVTASPPKQQPSYDASTHIYRMDNDVVDRATYMTAIDSVNRLFLAGTAIFLTVAVTLTLAHCCSRRTNVEAPMWGR